jgi:Transposase DNA-binding/Transposase Tn5 dimerisation domain
MWQDAGDWAEAEFGGAPGLEKRLRDRLVRTAAALADRPAGSLPERFAWAELKAAYRLVDRAAADPDALQAVHRARTVDRLRAVRGPALIVHDGTVLDYSGHPAVRDQLGPVTDAPSAGFIQHNSLAVDVGRGELLGLVCQQTFCRQPKPAGERRSARYHRPDRESRVWVDGVRAAGRAPAGACWVHVGDRAADFFALFAAAGEAGAHFLVRLVQDRAAAAPDGEAVRLMAAARAVPPTATGAVAVGGRGGRPGRTAAVCLGAVRLTVGPPKKEPAWRGAAPIAVTVVRIWEPDPPAGVEPLEWVLGTDLADPSPAALARYQGWYEWRWRTAEEYHKVQKTGCGIERLRFETKGRLRAAIALLSVVAVRVLALRWARDGRPGDPAAAVAGPEELAVLAALAPGEPPVRTVRQFVDRVAGLGGYLGRKGDGPPGWRTLWRGYQRLADLVLGASLPLPRPPTKPARCG